jgi:hypothetical protein
LLQFKKIPKVLLSSQAVRPMYDPKHPPLPPGSKKLCCLTFSAAVQAVDNVQNFKKTDSESLFPENGSCKAKPLGLVSPQSRRVFLAQNGTRQKDMSRNVWK